eukprot:m.59163 g.59163  ORF g.59163 m.59163 type:complete len:365 (+) comp34874_c0_seq1:2773-3867(+)
MAFYSNKLVWRSIWSTGRRVDDQKLKDGNVLLLHKGKLPPKGYVRLPVYLDGEGLTGRKPSSKSVFEWVKEGIQGFLQSSPSEPTETETKGESTSDMKTGDSSRFVFLGEVEISKTSTLADLKTRVSSLPQMADYEIPTMDFMRLRELTENLEPGRVFRRMNQSLSHHKMTSSMKVVCTVLNHEESQNQSAILLTVKQKLASEQSYGPSLEVVFDATSIPTPDSLKKCISDALKLPADSLVIAKHFPQKFEWTIIAQESNVVRGKAKGKKKGAPGAKKINLRHSPYFLRDGDAIGVLFSDRPVQNADFSTPEDDAGRATLLVLEEEKRERRRQRRHEADSVTRKRNPELGVQIFVPDFQKKADG